MSDTTGDASVVIEVQELVAPLGDDPKSIFKESDDNEEASDHRKVGLDWLADRIQHVLDLAGVLANCVQRA